MECGQRREGLGVALKALNEGRSISEEQWTSIGLMVKEFEPLLEDTSQTVLMEYYSFGEPLLADFAPATPLDSFVNAAALTDHYYERQDRWDLSLDAYRVAMNQMWFEPKTMLWTHFCVTRALNELIDALNLFADRCVSAKHLQSLLDELVASRGHVLHEVVSHYEFYQAPSILYRMQYRGYLKDFPDGQTPLFYKKKVEQELPGYCRYMRDTIPLSKIQQWYVAETLKDDSSLSDRVNNLLMDWVPELRVWGDTDDWGLLDSFSLHGRTRYELLMLKLVRRIAELTGEPQPQRVEDMVPKYLPSLVLDPFTSGTFAFDKSSQQFYSIGPDGVDNHLAIPYDPTNGSKSSGDVWVTP